MPDRVAGQGAEGLDWERAHPESAHLQSSQAERVALMPRHRSLYSLGQPPRPLCCLVGPVIRAPADEALPFTHRAVDVDVALNQGVTAFAVGFDRGTPLPVFRYHVAQVVGVGPQEQVSRVNAGRIVAVVADEEAIGDGPEVQFPREAVRSKRRSEVSGPEHSIPVHCAGLPLPAFTRVARRYVLPKGDFGRDWLRTHAVLHNEGDPGARRDPQRRPPVRGGRWQRDTRGRVDWMMYRRDQLRSARAPRWQFNSRATVGPA